MQKKIRFAIAAASIGIAAFGLTACNNNDSTGSSKESTTMEKMEKSSESMMTSEAMKPSDSMMPSDSMAPSDSMMMSDEMKPDTMMSESNH